MSPLVKYLWSPAISSLGAISSKDAITSDLDFTEDQRVQFDALSAPDRGLRAPAVRGQRNQQARDRDCEHPHEWDESPVAS